jgi:hypothetical protein
MSISGRVDGPETLARFVRALEKAPDFGVLFQNASRDGERPVHVLLTVGGFTGGEQR